MRIAIIGFGVEGKSARRFLRKKYPTGKIEIRDKKIRPDYLEGLEQFDLVVRSPGVKYFLPEVQRARKNGVVISSSTKLFFDCAPGTIIGITGTKGKGTTASMLYAILKAAGKDPYLVGNIGKPMLDIIPKLTRRSVTVVELSSFQLQDLERSPEIAVVLEIAPDHLDYHKNMREYVAAKSRIAAFQTRKNHVFYIARNAWSKKIARKSGGKKIPIDFAQPSLVQASDVKIPGRYNVNNAVVAASVALHMGVEPRTITKAIRNFRGLPYHLELMREIGGVRYFNDSASTNPISTRAALAAISDPKILIAGGVDKNFDYVVLKPALKDSTRLAILYGASRKKIAREIRGSVPVVFAADLSDAVTRAHKRARSGDAVLFSPASASFDMFKDSKDRGARFSRIVSDLS